MSVLQKTPVSVGVVAGNLVSLRIGAMTADFDYETALTIAQMLRVRGKEAKRLAGDRGRHWSAVGVLQDLNNVDMAEAARLLPKAVTLGVGIK